MGHRLLSMIRNRTYHSARGDLFLFISGYLSFMDQVQRQKLEDRLGYHFNDPEKLIRALTHPTYSKEAREDRHNPRECPDQSVYATLGDAVLKLGFTQILIEMKLNTKKTITDSKKDLEKNFHLARVGERLQLFEERFVYHRAGEGDSLEKASDAICSDTVEALFGAIYLDNGYSMIIVNECIRKVFSSELKELGLKNTG